MKDGADRNVRGTSREETHYKKPSGWLAPVFRA
jgi:hypothetical protein